MAAENLIESFVSVLSIKNFAHCVPILIFLSLIVKVIYNLYLHPLSKIPGPPLLSTSSIWWVRIAISGNQHEQHVALHEKYGPIVRVAPHFIMLNDPEYAAQFYKWDRTDYTLPFETTPRKSGVTTQADMRAHARQRKKVASGFSLSAVLQNEDLIDKHILLWLARLQEQAASKTAFNFSDWAQWLAMDVVMDIVFGSPLGFVKQGMDVSNLILSIRDMFVAATLLGHMPRVVRFMQLPFIWPFVSPKPTDDRGIGFIVGAGNKAIRKRIEKGNVEGRRDILQQWLEWRDKEGNGMTEEELQLETLGPIAAGSDTTGSAIRTMVLYIASNPRVHAKLLAELTTTSCTISRPIKYLEAQKLPYLQSIILETLRVYPPVGTPLSRLVPKGGVEILGYFIPENSWLLMPQWCLGRNKGVYGEDVAVWRPERWEKEVGETEEEAAERVERWKRLDTGFGSGQVLCLGRNIAMMEICKALVELFLNFDVQVVNPERPWKSTNMMVFVHEEFWIRLTPRGQV